MDPSFWQIPSEPPPPYEDVEPLAMEGPSGEEEIDEGDDDGDEGDLREANKILDSLELLNYDDVEMRLAEPEMTGTKQRNYVHKVIKDAETRRRQVISMKSNATIKFNKGQISEEFKNTIHKSSGKFWKGINDFIKHYKYKSKIIRGYGLKRGRGVYFFNNAKEMLEKLTMIVGEIQAGNTSLKMRNTGQNILDAMLSSKNINKSQYLKLVKKYFSV